LRLLFGLGGARRIDLLEIRWPSGVIERIRDCEADRILLVKEGSGVASVTGPQRSSRR
jgi:hypothetical protein